MTKTNTNTGLPISLLFLLVLAATLGSWQSGLLQMRFTNHSRTSHPEQVSKIDSCFEGAGLPSPIFRMSNGRFSQFCNDGNEQDNNYWRIYECEGTERVVVTQFKQGIRRLENYIRNHGMVPESPPC